MLGLLDYWHSFSDHYAIYYIFSVSVAASRIDWTAFLILSVMVIINAKEGSWLTPTWIDRILGWFVVLKLVYFLSQFFLFFILHVPSLL